MKVTDLNKKIAEKEGKVQSLSIAQIAEVTKCMREVIAEECGIDLYKDIIRKI